MVDFSFFKLYWSAKSWKPIKILHPCGFQDFLDQSSLTKLKSTIIQYLDINAQELRHWFSLWVFPIVPRTILIENLITLSISDCERPQNIQSSIYTTQNTVLNMNRQVSTLLITKTQSNKPFRKFSYQRRASLAWPYMLFFNLRTISCCSPSLLKSLGSSMKTG